MADNRTVDVNKGAIIITRQTEKRSVTADLVDQLRRSGASRDLIEYAERHQTPKPAR